MGEREADIKLWPVCEMPSPAGALSNTKTHTMKRVMAPLDHMTCEMKREALGSVPRVQEGGGEWRVEE